MRTMTRRMAATAMPIPMPALAPVLMPEEALLTRADVGRAFVAVVKKARKDVATTNVEDMLCAAGVRVLRPAKHETRWSCGWARYRFSEIAVVWCRESINQQRSGYNRCIW